MIQAIADVRVVRPRRNADSRHPFRSELSFRFFSCMCAYPSLLTWRVQTTQYCTTAGRDKAIITSTSQEPGNLQLRPRAKPPASLRKPGKKQSLFDNPQTLVYGHCLPLPNDPYPHPQTLDPCLQTTWPHHHTPSWRPTASHLALQNDYRIPHNRSLVLVAPSSLLSTVPSVSFTPRAHAKFAKSTLHVPLCPPLLPTQPPLHFRSCMVSKDCGPCDDLYDSVSESKDRTVYPLLEVLELLEAKGSCLPTLGCYARMAYDPHTTHH